jgi:myosin I
MTNVVEQYQRKFEGPVEDLILPSFESSDENIKDALKERYKDSNIYTYLGSTLIAVNPYSNKPKDNQKIYSNEVKNIYHKHNPYELTPHIYSLAESAYRTMKQTGKPQVVIISGESGAGKTVSARLVMEYIAAVSVSGVATDHIKRVVNNTNPILEAFGNAKTLRNDNSSRFGKHTELFFNFKGQLEGGYISTSLLEKQRVITQRAGERNYHIFYQLCVGADDALKSGLNLGNPKQFAYLSQTDPTIKGVNDKQDFRHTCEALAEAGILVTEQMEIFRVIAGVLHLGNLRFAENKKDNAERAVITTRDVLKNVCLALSVEEAALEEALLNRKIKVATGSTTGEITVMAQNPEQAAKNRDALAKDIYERLFNWIIKRVLFFIFLKLKINAAVKKPDEAKFAIGILDIYGFEIYQGKENTMEQLNINFVNEKIQQLVAKWLQKEQEEYVEEGVTIPDSTIKIKSSTECIKLLEGKPIGVYSLLDEESLLRGFFFFLTFPRRWKRSKLHEQIKLQL